MSKMTIIFLVFCAFSQCFSQQQLRSEMGDVYYDPLLYNKNYNGTQGSPYLNEKFELAQINDINGAKLVRFDAFMGRVEIKQLGKVIFLRESESFIIKMKNGSDKIYETHQYLEKGKNLKTSFFEVRNSTDNYDLYYQNKIKFFKEVKAQGYSKREPAQFREVKGAYFINDFINKSEVLIKIPSKKRKFLELFSDKSKKFEKYMKNKNFDLSNLKDLVSILNFYFEN